ncbi:hypothetical protein IVB46_28010 [Bradyrhizobium sp. 61]|uniref:hypothetical protein n=1 Tax=unclassified Bradyrhizobium TaxID=2631580 RepID=UPI001FF97AE5|nr:MULTISPECIES: hypothetical protein [unclassified Bradyrhizobium]MCK1279075.1 hypothetical protein [Bradyrhizobium sp. 61]MCK1449261.1 hypothetical protein [Bradyrhizobium sp. 48]MCK1457209.1 hypothetical protein [Bradyrhizobium sp. 2]
MCVALLTYADLSARLNISREAARALARRRRLPRSRSEDGKALVSVDLAELRYTPRPRIGRKAAPIAAPMAEIEAFKIEAFKIEAFKAEIARLEALAAGARLVFERERERADRLAVELLQAAAETAAANAWAARLEDEVADLRTGRQAGGTTAGAARRLGHLAAAIVGADRAARR